MPAFSWLSNELSNDLNQDWKTSNPIKYNRLNTQSNPAKYSRLITHSNPTWPMQKRIILPHGFRTCLKVILQHCTRTLSYHNSLTQLSSFPENSYQQKLSTKHKNIVFHSKQFFFSINCPPENDTKKGIKIELSIKMQGKYS